MRRAGLLDSHDHDPPHPLRSSRCRARRSARARAGRGRRRAGSRWWRTLGGVGTPASAGRGVSARSAVALASANSAASQRTGGASPAMIATRGSRISPPATVQATATAQAGPRLSRSGSRAYPPCSPGSRTGPRRTAPARPGAAPAGRPRRAARPARPAARAGCRSSATRPAPAGRPAGRPRPAATAPPTVARSRPGRPPADSARASIAAGRGIPCPACSAASASVTIAPNRGPVVTSTAPVARDAGEVRQRRAGRPAAAEPDHQPAGRRPAAARPGEPASSAFASPTVAGRRSRGSPGPACPRSFVSSCRRRSRPQYGTADLLRRERHVDVLTPRSDRASTTALTTAAAGGTVAISPAPLAPSGLCGLGVAVGPSVKNGTSAARGRAYSVRSELKQALFVVPASSISACPRPCVMRPRSARRRSVGCRRCRRRRTAVYATTSVSPVSSSTSTTATCVPNG